MNIKTTRRKFFKSATMGGLGSALLVHGCAEPNKEQNTEDTNNTDYAKLDEVLSQPVLKQSLFKSPVIIDTVELLHFDGNFICRVRSKDGVEGISVSNNYRMHYLYPIFVKQIAPFFIEKDARSLDQLLEEVYVYKSNYKMQGYAVFVPLATLEFAILDMLGKIAQKPMGELIGDTNHTHVAVYQANNFRGKSAEESIDLIEKQVRATSAKALKFKVAGRMSSPEQPPRRSEKLIPLVRERFGDEMTIYADANGGYTPEEAIRIGKLMEENKFDFFEEPVPFDWYQETKQVTDALNVPMAGGEQEPSMHNFRWLIGNDALDILQPDIFYFGGMIRSMKVANMAKAAGKPCTPHISGSGLGYLYMMHFVSVVANAGPFHEFKGLNDKLPMECPTSDLQVNDGKVKVPTGPGLGVNIDPAYIAKHKPVDVI